MPFRRERFYRKQTAGLSGSAPGGRQSGSLKVSVVRSKSMLRTDLQAQPKGIFPMFDADSNSATDPKDQVWDFAAVHERRGERRVLSNTDVKRLHLLSYSQWLGYGRADRQGRNTFSSA